MFSATPLMVSTESISDIAIAAKETNCGWVGDSYYKE
jgi:hypothetical protein